MFKITSLLIVVTVIMFSTMYALKIFTTTTGGKGPVSTPVNMDNLIKAGG